MPVLSAVTEQRAPLLIIADEVSGDALTLLVLNVTKRRLPAVAVKAPAFGPDRMDALRDIAVLTGAEVVGPGIGRVSNGWARTTGSRGPGDCDPCRHHHVGGHGEPAALAARARQAEAELAFLESDYEREKRRVRLAQAGGRCSAHPSRPRYAGRTGGDAPPHPRRSSGGSRRTDRRDRAGRRDHIAQSGGRDLERAATATRRPAARSLALRWRRRSASSRPTRASIRRLPSGASAARRPVTGSTSRPTSRSISSLQGSSTRPRSSVLRSRSPRRCPDRACEPT